MKLKLFPVLALLRFSTLAEAPCFKLLQQGLSQQGHLLADLGV